MKIIRVEDADTRGRGRGEEGKRAFRGGKREVQNLEMRLSKGIIDEVNIIIYYQSHYSKIMETWNATTKENTKKILV